MKKGKKEGNERRRELHRDGNVVTAVIKGKKILIGAGNGRTDKHFTSKKRCGARSSSRKEDFRAKRGLDVMGKK